MYSTIEKPLGYGKCFVNGDIADADTKNIDFFYKSSLPNHDAIKIQFDFVILM